MLFGTLPLIVGWLFLRQRQFNLQEFVAVSIFGIYAFAVIVTFAIILLWGFKRLELSEAFVKWLGGATVAEVAGMVLCVVKYLFPSGK